MLVTEFGIVTDFNIPLYANAPPSILVTEFGISREEPLLELNNKYLSPPSQITENVYLGNIYDARNLERLQKLGINKVLSIITDPNLVSYPESIEHKLIDIV